MPDDGFAKSPIHPRRMNISLRVALVIAAYNKYAAFLGHLLPYLGLFTKPSRIRLFTNSLY